MSRQERQTIICSFWIREVRSPKGQRQPKVIQHYRPNSPCQPISHFAAWLQEEKAIAATSAAKVAKTIGKDQPREHRATSAHGEQVEQITPKTRRGKPSPERVNGRTPRTLNRKHNPTTTLRLSLKEISILLHKEAVIAQKRGRRVQDEGEDCLTTAAEEVRSVEGDVRLQRANGKDPELCNN